MPAFREFLPAVDMRALYENNHEAMKR